MPDASTYRGALEAFDRIVNRGGEADQILRTVVELLHDLFENYDWVGISFVEDEKLVLGPGEGKQPPDRPQLQIPILYEGRVVAELGVEPDPATAFSAEDRTFLERVALMISPYCLVGWDTGGEPWS
jgi:putative methionine-R-sulfoxide reductase with GAF domain